MTINTVPAVLSAVHDLICLPEIWCHGTEARNAAGRPVKATDPAAVAWSISGAIERVIDPEAPDLDYDECARRCELEVETYHALGISTEPADGALVRHDVVLSVLNHAQGRFALAA